jgi:hypothetical protein
MPLEKGFMQSRDATVNPVYISEAHRDCTVQYSTVLKESGFLKVNPIHGKTRVKSDVTQSQDAKTTMNFPGIDGFVNENLDTGSIKRTIIEWTQRI